MAIDTIKTSAITDGSITSDDINYPLATFSSTGIDDNAASTSITIDSSQNVLVGKTTTSINTAGAAINSNGAIETARDGSTVLALNRLTSDGTIASLYSGGNLVSDFVSDTGRSLLIEADPDNGAASSYLGFAVDGSEAARFDATGNLLVSKSTSDRTVAGGEILSSGGGRFTRDGADPLYLNRLTDDGALISFRRNDTVVGSIGIQASGFYIDGESGHEGMRFANGAITPRENGSDSDGTSDLGASNNRFKDLYLSGGAYIGGTGSANFLDDYEEGSGTFTLEDATSGGNVSSTTGSFDYVKIGKVVHLRYNFENINTSGLTAGNSLYVHGFPFTATQNHRGIVFSQFLNVDTGTYDIEFRINNGTTYGFWNMCKDAASGAVVTASDMSSGNTDMRGSITYFTPS